MQKDARTALESLLKELEATPAENPEKQAVLDDLTDSLRQMLAEDAEQQTLLDRLQTTVEHYEVNHPDLTTMISSMINILSTGGV